MRGGQQADPSLGRLEEQTSGSLCSQEFCSKKSFWPQSPEKKPGVVTLGHVAQPGSTVQAPVSMSWSNM